MTFFKVEGTVNKHGDSNQTVLAWKRKIEPPAPPPKKNPNNNKKRGAIGTFLGDAYSIQKIREVTSCDKFISCNVFHMIIHISSHGTTDSSCSINL